MQSALDTLPFLAAVRLAMEWEAGADARRLRRATILELRAELRNRGVTVPVTWNRARLLSELGV